ncbi:MAG: hypothetical protein ACOCUL_03090, partial [Bacteroidota bacterium]
KAVIFILNQLGYVRGKLSLYDFASQKVDTKFPMDYGKFVVIYLKLKYSQEELSDDEKKQIRNFGNQFHLSITREVPVFKLITGFINFPVIIRYIRNNKRVK